jgi:polyisoprenoid-binding protein YceI
MKKALTLALSLIISSAALADWTLDNEHSVVNFTSTKNISKSEINQFDLISGSISDSAKVNISIDLSSANTHVEIRDQRIKKHLFNSSKLTDATITTQLDKGLLRSLASSSKTTKINAALTLNGITKTIVVDVQATQLPSGAIAVKSLKPIQIDAVDYLLNTGIDTLKDIAKLSSISYIVPVTFDLTFKQNNL